MRWLKRFLTRREKMLHNPQTHKLGKRLPKHDSRDLALERYLPPILPPIPAISNWGKKITSPWEMLGNDRWGDCTCATVGHVVMEMTSDTGTEVIPTEQDVLGLYSTVTGQEGAAFDPVTGANDDGCYIADVLKEWRRHGFIGHKLGAYATVNLKDPTHLRAAIHMFGAVNIGLWLPISAQTQDVWIVSDPSLQGDAQPGSWGGHSVPIIGYDTHKKVFVCVTWGQIKLIKWAFLEAYCDEAWALLSDDWVSGSGTAPSGFDLQTLQNDLAALRSTTSKETTSMAMPKASDAKTHVTHDEAMALGHGHNPNGIHGAHLNLDAVKKGTHAALEAFEAGEYALLDINDFANASEVSAWASAHFTPGTEVFLVHRKKM